MRAPQDLLQRNRARGPECVPGEHREGGEGVKDEPAGVIWPRLKRSCIRRPPCSMTVSELKAQGNPSGDTRPRQGLWVLVSARLLFGSNDDRVLPGTLRVCEVVGLPGRSRRDQGRGIRRPSD
jgi:hypothetical protein